MSNSKVFNVNSLEKKALDACFNDITSTLRIVNLKSWIPQSSLNPLFPQLSSEQIVNFIRERLSDGLTKTTLNDKVRKGLLAQHMKANKKSFNSSRKAQSLLFLFLDAVLDDSFTELEVIVPGNVAVKDKISDLIQVIAKHCPNLSSLKFNFGKPITKEMGLSFAQSFLGLKNLTKLTISDLTKDEYCIPFLEELGNSCPNLTHLCIKSKFLLESKDHILALLLGGRAKLLPSIAKLSSRGEKTREFMKSSHFHPDLLSAICNSLKELLLQCVECNDDYHGRLSQTDRFFTHTEYQEISDDDEDDWNFGCFEHGYFRCQCRSHLVSRDFLAFLLRHMPNLEKVAETCSDRNFETSRAVEILHSVPSRFYQPVSSSYENNPGNEGADCLKPEDGIVIKIMNKGHQLFRGPLSLVELGSVNMKSGNVMRAISSLCVRPKAASFFHICSDVLAQNLDCSCEECYDGFQNSSDDDEDGQSITEQIISDHQLEMTLKDWPKVRSVKLTQIPLERWKVVASIIGSQLTSLVLIGIAKDHIFLGDLQLCTLLQDLEIPGIALSSESNATQQVIDVDIFLPKLKNFKSHGCLGVYSHLFEEKRTLKYLSLSCSHISTAASKFNWDQVYYEWQDLHTLKIRSTANLSPSSLPVLVSRLKKLKILVLSERMFQSLEETGGHVITDRFIAELKRRQLFINRNISITIFRNQKDTKSCPFLK